jgi:hypothetical protein
MEINDCIFRNEIRADLIRYCMEVIKDRPYMVSATERDSSGNWAQMLQCVLCHFGGRMKSDELITVAITELLHNSMRAYGDEDDDVAEEEIYNTACILRSEHLLVFQDSVPNEGVTTKQKMINMCQFMRGNSNPSVLGRFGAGFYQAILAFCPQPENDMWMIFSSVRGSQTVMVCIMRWNEMPRIIPIDFGTKAAKRKPRNRFFRNVYLSINSVARGVDVTDVKEAYGTSIVFLPNEPTNSMFDDEKSAGILRDVGARIGFTGVHNEKIQFIRGRDAVGPLRRTHVGGKVFEGAEINPNFHMRITLNLREHVGFAVEQASIVRGDTVKVLVLDHELVGSPNPVHFNWFQKTMTFMEAMNEILLPGSGIVPQKFVNDGVELPYFEVGTRIAMFVSCTRGEMERTEESTGLLFTAFSDPRNTWVTTLSRPTLVGKDKKGEPLKHKEKQVFPDRRQLTVGLNAGAGYPSRNQFQVRSLLVIDNTSRDIYAVDLDSTKIHSRIRPDMQKFADLLTLCMVRRLAAEHREQARASSRARQQQLRDTEFPQQPVEYGDNGEPPRLRRSERRQIAAIQQQERQRQEQERQRQQHELAAEEARRRQQQQREQEEARAAAAVEARRLRQAQRERQREEAAATEGQTPRRRRRPFTTEQKEAVMAFGRNNPGQNIPWNNLIREQPELFRDRDARALSSLHTYLIKTAPARRARQQNNLPPRRIQWKKKYMNLQKTILRYRALLRQNNIDFGDDADVTASEESDSSSEESASSSDEE